MLVYNGYKMTTNKDTSRYYDSFLFAVKNAAAFMPLIMIPFGLLARGGLVDGRFYTSDLTFAAICILYSMASIGWLLYVRAQSQLPRLIGVMLTVLFHALTLIFVLFVSGFLSAFLSVWIVLMISADIRFGTKGFFASFGALVLAGMLSLVVHPEMPASEQFEVLQGIVVVGAIGFVIARIRSITDRERQALATTREQEAYQREQLLALVNSMGDAVLATDKTGVIKIYNSTLLNLLDTNRDLTGKPIDEVMQFVDAAGHPVTIMADARKRGVVFSRTDLSLKSSEPESELVRLYINVAPIQPGYRSHTESGFIFILRDITKEKTLEEERDEFISVVSHELRTPIAIAEGTLSNIMLLQDRGASPEMLKSTAKSAHEHILYLAKLVNDLSTLSRAERGLGGEVEIIDLKLELQDIYKEYQPQAEQKGLEFDLDIPGRLPRMKTSKLYFEEILQNFITNSIKYTSEGTVTLAAKEHPQGLHVTVSDSGIGISKYDQKRIFEKFYRSEDYRTRETSGTGLGLYVCKKLAEKLHVKITFESRLNHGSSFGIIIPKEQFVTGGKLKPATPAGFVATK
jgi:signal transduction histidine kinase